jgi:methionyl aminopeptidase
MSMEAGKGIHKHTGIEIRRMQRIATQLFVLFRDIARVPWVDKETKAVDRYVQRFLGRHGMTSALSDYRGYPAHSSISVNEVAVHGVPNDRKIRRGDIFTVDVAAFGGGYVSDTAWTYHCAGSSHRHATFIGAAWTLVRRLSQRIAVNTTIRDIGVWAEEFASELGVSIVPEFVGHGIGKALHESPVIPFYATSDGTSREWGAVRLPEGAIVNIEPVVADGGVDIELLDDRWGYRLSDGTRTAHFELSVLVTRGGGRILQFDGIPADDLPLAPPFGRIPD